MKTARLPEPVLVTHLFPELLQHLIRVLSSLGRLDWKRPTSSPGWSVHDVALHLLGGDVGQLSGLRDRHERRATRVDGWKDLVNRINEQNEKWVAAARTISPALLIDLLELTGQQTNRFFATLDVNSIGPVVSWAGPDPAPMWLHIAREYTERWHHQQQIREAVGSPLLSGRKMFHPVLATFVYALPRTYRSVPAEEGTMIRMTIVGDAGDRWSLIRDLNSWTLSLDDGMIEPDSQIRILQEDAWRLFTGSAAIQEVRPRVKVEGNQSLGSKALETVAMIV